MKFLELHTQYGIKGVLINTDQIKLIKPYGNGSIIYVADEKSGITVIESFDSLKTMLTKGE